MSKIEKELGNLKAAFAAVAVAIREEQPDVWAEAMEIWQDEEMATRFLVKPNMNLNGESPVGMAAKSDEDKKQVMNLLGRIKYGVY